jgi:hypothetical protein
LLPRLFFSTYTQQNNILLWKRGYSPALKLTYNNLCTEWVCNWHTTIKELCPNFIYKPGKEQILADFLSWHPQLEEAELDKYMLNEEPRLDDWNNKAEAVFIHIFYYPIDSKLSQRRFCVEHQGRFRVKHRGRGGTPKMEGSKNNQQPARMELWGRDWGTGAPRTELRKFHAEHRGQGGIPKREGSNNQQPAREELRPGLRNRSTEEGTEEVSCGALRPRNGKSFVRSTKAKEERARWRDTTTNNQ